MNNDCAHGTAAAYILLVENINNRRDCPCQCLCCFSRESNTYILVGKSEGKKSLGRLRHRWGNDIKIGVKGIPVG
jgi:hypothetical protein